MRADDNVSFFLKLFARGRYVTSRSIARNEAVSNDPGRKHEERERFGVAAIALCAAHDARFRARFLQIVAGLTKADIDLIDVEPKRWGDLVLEGKRDVIVLEFKLKASLGEHQDPNSKTKLFATAGYGAEIIAKYGETGKRLRYVIVGKDVPEGRTSEGLRYNAVQWSRFLRRNERESTLERDLFDCLGILGAPIFLSRHMKKKAPTQEATGALEVYQLLERAAGNIPTGAAASGRDYIGFDLSAGRATPGSQHKILKDIVDPKGRSLGWIGYEHLDQLYLSAWFYSSETGKNRVRRRLRTLEAARRGDIVEDKPSEGTSVGFKKSAAQERDHEAWLKDVLRTVAGKT
jgi:hypothetical protein